MNFTDHQKALIIEADVLDDQASSTFLAMGDAKTQAQKLELLEKFHGLNVRAIELLRLAGDPGTVDRRAREVRQYDALRQDYLTWDPDRQPPLSDARAEFEAARIAVIRGA